MMAAATAAAFYTTAPGGFLSDDFGILYQVSRSSFAELFRPPPSGSAAGFYRPAALVLWKLEYIMFGLAPSGYWAVSLLTHTANGFMVYLLVRRLADSVQVAVTAGLVFIAMPLQGEAVAWLSCAFDRLCLFFVLASLYLYVAYRDKGRPLAYGGSVMLFILAILSKEMAVTFPALAVLVEAFFWKKGSKEYKAAVLRVLPFAVVLGVYMYFRYHIFHGIGGYMDTHGQSRHTLLDPFTAAGVLWDMAWYWFFPGNRTLVPDSSLVYVVFLALYFWQATMLKTSARKTFKLFVFGLSWSVVTLQAVMSMLPLFPDLNRGRYIYLPTVGFAVFMAGIFAPASGMSRSRRRVSIGLSAVLLTGYLYIDSINYSTWPKAYGIARSIPSQVVRDHPNIPFGARLYFKGVPDNYKGAFIYRNGLSESLAMAYGYNGRGHLQVDYLMKDDRVRGKPSMDYAGLVRSRPDNLYVFAYSPSTDKVTTLYQPQESGRPPVKAEDVKR